jgi:hypothetical protein
MGLAEDIKALQELRDKGELSEPAYAAARDAAVKTHSGLSTVTSTVASSVPIVTPNTTSSTSFRLGRFIGYLLIPGLVVAVGFWFVTHVNSGSRPPNQVIASVTRTPVTLTDEVENLPAHSFKALALNLPYGGTVEVNLQVDRGNSVDVFLTSPDQLDAMKKEDWSNVRTFNDFNALKTTTYRRTSRLPQAGYYLVIRDTSLGVLSAPSSDISVKITLNP